MIGLDDSWIGKSITCYLGTAKDFVPDAKIQKENGHYYICQNIRDGIICSDKFGYNYSWRLDSNVNGIMLKDQKLIYTLY